MDKNKSGNGDVADESETIGGITEEGDTAGDVISIITHPHKSPKNKE
jgi:hypothetical protein